MKFKSISARNKRTGWNIENMEFNPMLALLVGASGVGKTKVLNVIKTLARIAKGESFNGLEWKVEFEQNEHDYVWEGEFVYGGDVGVELLTSEYEVVFAVAREKIIEDDIVLVDRVPDSIKFLNREIVKLDSTKSVVELLKEESSIKSIYEGFKQCYSLDITDVVIQISNYPLYKEKRFDIKQIKQFRSTSLLEKLFLLRENGLQEFDVIVQKFKGVFPAIENIDFKLVESVNHLYFLYLRIKENNVSTWIDQPDISSGMMRTLLQIITLVLANDGDVIMIDEFENGLGVNCINELADLIMEPEANIQVVMTSHHPYIINAIPVKDWMILTRNGSNVHVHTADELHIGEHSKHEAFMQLMQTPEYRTGQNR